MGPVYQHFFEFAALWGPASAALGLIVWLSLRRLQPDLTGASANPVDRAGRFFFAPLSLRHDWLWLVAGCTALLLATDHLGFTHGFFRWDDFSFLQVASEDRPLGKMLNLYHNDHSLPLFRLWVWTFVTWAGPAATTDELALFFNAAIFFTCLGVLLGGTVLLSICGVRRITAVCFCVFAWMWPGWGEFTTGFFTLIAYPQTLVFGFFATALCAHAFKGEGRWPFWLAGLFCTLVAGGIDISGVWIFFAIGGFAFAFGGWRNRTVRQITPWLLMCFGLVAYYHLAWFHHAPEPRELVQNPLGRSVNHSLIGNALDHFWRLPLATVSGLGGTLLSIFTPGFLGMTAPQFYGNGLRSTPLYLAEFSAVAGIVILGWRQGHRTSAADRRLLAAFAWPVIVIIGMTVIARVQNLDLPGTLWPTKYLCLPQTWAVLALVFLLDRTALADSARASRAARWIVVSLIAAGWLITTFWFMEKSLGIHTARRPSGRQGNTEAAIMRRNDFQKFQTNIQELARRTGRQSLDIPPPDGFYWAHPYLEYGYDPVLGGTYQFSDLMAAAPSFGITLKVRPREEISPETLTAIQNIPSLAQTFDASAPHD
jgi:hypothetical protein